MSPEMRRDVAMVDPRFDPRMMDLQREARRQGRGERGQPVYWCINELTAVGLCV